MNVSLQPALSDVNLDAGQGTSQRQLAMSVSAIATERDRNLPLNLCLILDRSGSMNGRPLDTVRQAAERLIDELSPGDRLSVVAFDHRAQVIVDNQVVVDTEVVKQQIRRLRADGGTAIDEGMKLGIEELAKGKGNTVSQAFLLTDGENEHGDNQRCLKLAQVAASYNITINTLGFGNHWNQDVLERIADEGGGAIAYIEQPDAAVREFGRLFRRIQSVGLTNAYLLLTLNSGVRLAELKPIAQVAPETIELAVQPENGRFAVRLGDLMRDDPRVVLANLYIGQLPPGHHAIAQVQVRYDDPALGLVGMLSEAVIVDVNSLQDFRPQPDANVQRHVLALAKYRQTQLAEEKLKQGDRAGAATMLQTAANTAIQMGDKNAATVLQTSATQLQAGKELSEGDRKKTRIVSKTTIQDN